MFLVRGLSAECCCTHQKSDRAVFIGVDDDEPDTGDAATECNSNPSEHDNVSEPRMVSSACLERLTLEHRQVSCEVWPDEVAAVEFELPPTTVPELPEPPELAELPVDQNIEYVIQSLPRVELGEEFGVTLRKDPGNIFGVKVTQSNKHGGITVKNVGPGLIEDWNTLYPNQCVECGDKLVEVCGVRNSTAVMMEKLKTEEVLELIFVRCS
mmetsp:Transcript_36530/g.97307  ORF Transcript_36530/g.97307 Transcript_36530/m.97307 type:complete len:211 (-) Transcript_36530:263-895(-)